MFLLKINLIKTLASIQYRSENNTLLNVLISSDVVAVQNPKQHSILKLMLYIPVLHIHAASKGIDQTARYAQADLRLC